MLHCRSFSSFSVFSFLKYFIPANKAPPIANVMAKDFQETGPGFKGAHGVSAALPFWGPDDLGGGGIAVSRGRLPRQQAASPEARHASSGLAQSRPSKTLAVSFPGPQTPNPRGKRRQSWLPGSRIIRPGASNSPAISSRDRASFDPPLDFRRRFRLLRK